MCGLLGIVSPRGMFAQATVERALGTMRRRGPDDALVTRLDAPHGRDVWLGHRRLSILDLSSAGRQPMDVGSADQAFVGVFNGEVYNYQELRRLHLYNESFRSTSDTEVLLRGLKAVGPEFLRTANGMFAFACFDSAESTLLLGRDRLGKKPLYVWRGSDTFAFASSL